MVVDIIVSNKVSCRKCGDIIESLWRHHVVNCRCGAIFIDGGKEYLRRGGNDLDDIIEMSEIYQEEYKSIMEK